MAYCYVCFTTNSVLLSLSLDYVHLQVRTQFAKPRLPLNHEFRATLLPHDPASVPLTPCRQFVQHMTTTSMMAPSISYGASQRKSACQSPWKISWPGHIVTFHVLDTASWWNFFPQHAVLCMFERPKSVTTRVTLDISNKLWLHYWHRSSNDLAAIWISNFTQIFCFCCCLVARTPNIYHPLQSLHCVADCVGFLW